MTTEVHLYLVVDACVLNAAGKTQHPRSENCRTVLQGILDHGHFVVFSTEIHEEWERRSSSLGNQWRAQMLARRKLVHVRIPHPSTIRDEVLHHAASDVQHLLAKDIHLIEAALEADRVIFSLDLKARRHFSRLTPVVSELRGIAWVSPEVEFEVCDNCINGRTGDVDAFTLEALYQRSIVQRSRRKKHRRFPTAIEYELEQPQ